MKQLLIDDPASVLGDAKLDAIAERLDRIIALLEMFAFGPEGEECQHRRKEDHGVMGDAPGSKIYCLDCKQYIASEG